MLSTQHELMKELPAAEETATVSRRRRRSSVEYSDSPKVAKTSTITSATANQDLPANLTEDTISPSEKQPVESFDESMLAFNFFFLYHFFLDFTILSGWHLVFKCYCTCYQI